MSQLKCVVALAFGLALGSPARADYIIEVQSGGMNAIDVDVSGGGEVTVPIAIHLTRENGYEFIDTAIFDLAIDNGGLRYDAYEWNPAYFETDFPNDESTRPTTPPTVLSSIHFGNLILIGDNWFTEGTLLTADLTIPAGTPAAQVFHVSFEFDTLAHESVVGGFYVDNTISNLTITTVPEPGTVVLLGVGGLALWRQRVVNRLRS